MNKNAEQIVFNFCSNALNLEVLNTPQEIFGGLTNRVFKTETKQGVFAVKMMDLANESAKKDFVNAENLAKALSEMDINICCAIEYNGNILNEYNGKTFCVYKWIEGATISVDKEKDVHIIIAKLLADIHNKSVAKFGEFIHEKTTLSEDLFDYNCTIKNIKNKHLQDLVYKNKDFLNAIEVKAKNAEKNLQELQVLSHRDLDINNIVWQSANAPVIIDCELFGLINPYKELVRTALYWSGYIDCDINYKNFKSFFAEYYKYSSFKKPSKQVIESSLFGAVYDWLEWLWFNLKKINASLSGNKIAEKEAERQIKSIKNLVKNIEKLI